MLFSTNLLKQWIELPSDYSLLNKELIAKLFEIEHGETNRTYPDLLVLGKVTEVHKHPNADTLFVCQVHCGAHGNFQICTGWENVAAWQYVPTALPWCYLPAIDLTIGERKMRWEDSNGMICSKWELGIAEDEDKHRIRDMTNDVHCSDDTIGKSISELFPWMENIIFEVESVAITNRPDLRGHLWLAIESRAIFPQSSTSSIDSLITRAQSFTSTSIPELQQQTNATANKTCTIETEKCSYYSISTIDNALNSESVFPGRVSLLDLGHTPRRNRVDYSNYFMSLTGQPIHIFDRDKIIWNIIIKEASWWELFMDLTGKEHTLAGWDIIICDSEKILALAGIIGWMSSAFTEDTRSIAIEIAHFNPIQIRKTSTRLGLKTDAAVRFEKGINPLRTAFCVSENHRLLTENNEKHNTGAISNITECGNVFPNSAITLSLDLQKASQYIVGSIDEEIIKKIPEILEQLGYICRHCEESWEQLDVTTKQSISENGLLRSARNDEFAIASLSNNLTITPPIRRSDIQIIQDIYEDLARHIGLDNIPEIQSPIFQSRSKKTIIDFQHTLSTYLIQKHKLSQVECYPRYSENRIKTMNLNKESHFELLNPMDVATPFMAQSLLPGLLELAKKNYRFTLPIQVFEIGKVWKNEWTSEWISIHTKKVVAGIFVQKKWKHRWDDVYIKAKSLVQDICNTYHISELVYKQTTQEYLHPNKQVSISKNNKILWSVSQIHPSTLESLWFTDDIEIAYFKLNLEDLFSFSQVSKKINYHSNADQYIQRDLSFEIDSQSHYDQIISVFQKNNIIEDYTVIDLYKPEWSIKKSIAIRFTIIWDTSLTNDKVTEITNTIISEVEATGAILKGVKA